MAGKKGRGRRGSRANHNNVSNGRKGSRNQNNRNNNDNSNNYYNNAVANVDETPNAETDQKQDEPQIFSAVIKTLTGEKLDVQFGPGDSTFEIRQSLLDSKETCFITRYELLLHAKDGRVHQLEDHSIISEIADITAGGFFFEMIAALYDDRTIRVHVRHTQELLSLSNVQASPSLSLALQNEKEQNKATNSEDTMRSEVPELDGLGYLEDVSSFLGNLLPSPLKDIKCVESLVFSSFNPPPSYRRLVGDLLYLDVVTLEGFAFCITGSTRMFYVNSCTGKTFDPRPSKATLEATTLVALLQKISPNFKKAFREVLEQKAAAHTSENVQSSLLPNSWLGLYPVPDHRRDSIRAENSLTLLYGTEPLGMQREWNEELQSCRELPCTTQQERILRDRALHKVTSDFVDAAVNGAIGVISGCIPPINSTDLECFHMYLHNNIFFSAAIDTDIQHLSKKSSDANSNTWTTGTLHSSSEKSSDFQVPNGVKSDDSSSEDCINGLDVTQDTPFESQQAETDVATYASVNNDLNGTKAYQEIDVPGLYNLAVAIIDYRGRRVLAQSILPGILQGDNSDSLMYGSLDNGKKIRFDEDFHSKVLEAGKHLHLKEHSVLDRSGNVSKLAGAVECKGIVGSDDRHYLLDLVRVTPRDANYTGPGSRYCILRAELIAAFCQAQAAEKSKSKETNNKEAENLTNHSQNEADADKLDLVKEMKTEDAKELLSASADSYDHYDEIVFNPNVFTEIKLAGSPEEIAADENNVRKVSKYLTDVVIPKFIQDLCTLKVSPMDGRSLTEALHAHGINVRYIGNVAGGIRHLPHLWDLCTNEIVVRSSKHIINDVLRDTEDHDLASAISHLFNCLFGNCQALNGKIANGTQSRAPKREYSKWQPRMKGWESLKNSLPSYMSIDSEALWSDIQEFAMIKYKFELPEDASSHVKKISVIRNLCLKLGITIATHKYDLNSATPFRTSDILDLHPVVKHSIPVSSEAKELVEAGKLQFAEVTGPVHREVANCCRYLAMVLYHAGDMAGAITQQQKELIINERCLGLDHPDTAHRHSLFF
ncbi:hypothetical protein VNO77_39503 [Canavalia gladiata]|uniref:Clu domain-containing protein n=1 Tax=Canavalia gladiata TaxID=3824 RepID=A0AAN9KCP9_CANGL